MIAWARNRRAMVAVYTTIFVAMFLWVAWSFAVGQALSDLITAPDPQAFIPASVAAALISGVINIVYFGGAVVGGQVTL